MSASDYHSLELPAPALSASIIKTMVSESCLHAWSAHPQLNQNYARNNKKMFDDGEGRHALFLEGRDAIAVIDADSYRTNAAKAQRDEAYAAGRTPMLIDDYQEALEGVTMAHAELSRCKDLCGYTLADGKPEQTIVCQIAGVWCKGRIDHLADEMPIMLDYKSSSGSAEPGAAYRRVIDQMGGDLQAAFYELLVYTATGRKVDLWFMPQENSPPYACSFFRPAPAQRSTAMNTIVMAIVQWKECLQTGVWPGYSDNAYSPDPKPWLMAQRLTWVNERIDRKEKGAEFIEIFNSTAGEMGCERLETGDGD